MNIENKLLEILKILGEVTPEQISYELKIDLVKKTNEAINYTHCCTELPTLLENTNRVEVIDQQGRTYVNWKPTNKVELSLQDDKKTVKVFING